MNEHLLQAIEDCDHGIIPFNIGMTRAFLFGKKWYPLRAVVNYARHLAGEGELTTDRALVEIANLGYYVRITNVDFLNNFPIQLNNPEIIAETFSISKILERLARP